MKQVLYRTPGDFLKENREFLRQREAACQLNIGNAQHNREELCRADLLFGRYEEKGEPLLLFGHTAPWNICLNGLADDLKTAQAAGLLARYFRKEKISISGVNASKALCEAFFEAYGGKFTLRASMDIMVLKKLREPQPVPGHIRRAEADDLPLLTEWILSFHWDALKERPDPAVLQEKMLSHLETGVFLWVTPQGTPVSMAARASRTLPHGIGITYVYTPPEHRSKGYAQNNVAAICREALLNGADYCSLFVDEKNPISNRAYQKIGFEILEDNFDYRLDPSEEA